MKFGVSYNTGFYGLEPDRLTAFARHAEDCGFESLYVPEHIVLYPGATMGRAQIPPALPIADPLECLTFVAAATRRILLGTAVLLLPYRHPVVLAKQLATIDVLSAGRMRLLTAGLGTLPGEAQAIGVDFASRGRRADEAIDVLRLLWAGDEDGTSFAGEFFSFTGLCSFPKPYGAGGLPVHVGGSSRAAARRAGRGATATFPAAPSGRRSGRRSWSSCGGRRRRRAGSGRPGVHAMGHDGHVTRRRRGPRRGGRHPPGGQPRDGRPGPAAGRAVGIRGAARAHAGLTAGGPPGPARSRRGSARSRLGPPGPAGAAAGPGRGGGRPGAWRTAGNSPGKAVSFRPSRSSYLRSGHDRAHRQVPARRPPS